MTTQAVVPDVPTELNAEKIESLVVQASNIVAVKSNAEYVRVAELSRALRSMKKQWVEWWDTNKCKPAYRLWKTLVADRDNGVKPMDEAIGKMDSATLAWDQEQERLRKEQERVAAEAIRKQQEADAMAAAESLAASGDAEGAERVLEAACEAPPPAVVIPRSTPTVAGRSVRTQWIIEVVDVQKVPREYMVPDMVALGQVARALKANCKIPGTRVREVPIVSQRS